MAIDFEISDDEFNKKKAKQGSWLNKLFSESEIDVNEKKNILKDLLSDHTNEQ